MRILSVLLIIFELPFVILCQSRIDSLKQLSNDPKQRVYSLFRIGTTFIEEKKFDSAIFYLHQSIRENIGNAEVKAASLNAMGAAFASIGDTDSSVFYYEDALKLFNQIGNNDHLIILETNLSSIYKNKGLYEKSLSYAFSALSKLERQPPDRTLASIYNTIGLTYANIDEYNKALQYHTKALNVRKQINYDRGVGQSYNNIGDVFIKMKSYDSALSNLIKALHIKESIGEKPAVTLNNIGEVLLKQGKTKEAADYFVRSLKLREELNDNIGKSVVLNNLGKVELLLNNLKQSEVYFTQSEQLSRKTGSLNELKVSLEQEVIVYRLLGEYHKALRSSEELIEVKDSLLNKEKAESLLTLQIRYETEKKDQQIELLNKDKALQEAQLEVRRSWIMWLSISALVLGTLVAVIFKLFRTSQKSKKKVELLLQELHHRVKNNLQTLSSLFMLQSLQIKDEVAIQAIKSSEGRVNAMALIHKKLYSTDQNREINIKEYTEDLVRYLVRTYGYANKEFALNLDIQEKLIDVDKAISVGLILNELVSNALKYAFASNPNPQLRLHLAVNPKDELEIEVIDNGSGFDTNNHGKTTGSFGLRMVKTLLKDLKGKMNMISNNGITVSLNIPMNRS